MEGLDSSAEFVTFYQQREDVFGGPGLLRVALAFVFEQTVNELEVDRLTANENRSNPRNTVHRTLELAATFLGGLVDSRTSKGFPKGHYGLG